MEFSPSIQTVSDEEAAKAISLAKQLHVFKPGIVFVPGAKLEALDTRDNKWYTCRVVEIDWGELDVQVHYENWSARFNEWLKMDSTRIRPSKPLTPKKQDPKKMYNDGQKVLGFWAPDSKWYPAKIVKRVTLESYNLLFYDGISKTLRTNQIQKLQTKEDWAKFDAGVTEVEKQKIPPSIVSQPIKKIDMSPTSGSKDMSTPKDDKSTPDGGTMRNKRNSKKNPAVEELFQSIRNKRRRSGTSSEREDSDGEENEGTGSINLKDHKEKTSEIAARIISLRKKEKNSESTSGTISLRSKEKNCEVATGEISLRNKEKGSEIITGTISLRGIKRPAEDDEESDIAESDSSSESEYMISESESDKSLKSEEDAESKDEDKFDLDDKSFSGFEVSSDQMSVSESLSSLLGIEIPQEDHHICPQDGCGKSFRKENLLRMHMKHFHADANKGRKQSLITVADLALERIASEQENMDVDVPPKANEDNSKKIELDSKISKEAKIILNPLDMQLRSSPKKSKKTVSEGKGRKGKRLANIEEDSVDVSSRGRIIKKKPVLDGKCISQTVHTEASSDVPKTPVEDDAAEADSKELEEVHVINCECRSIEEDGLMLQCDICLCWQHGNCCNIETEEMVPDSYICSLCDNPKAMRPSAKYAHHQDWLKEGKLPRFTGTPENTRLEQLIKTSHHLLGNVLDVSDVIHSLRSKLTIAKQKDHPKLVMWHKKWKHGDDIETKSDQKTKSIPEVLTTNSLSSLHQFINSQPEIGNLNYNGSNNHNGNSEHKTVDKQKVLKVIEKLMKDEEVEKIGEYVVKDENVVKTEDSTEQDATSSQPNTDENKNFPRSGTDEAKEALEELYMSLNEQNEQNVGSDIADLLSNSELDKLVHQASAEFSRIDDPQVSAPRAPIIPEAERIEPVKCRLNLLDHVEKMQTKVFNRFDKIEEELKVLEAEMGLTSELSKEEEELLSEDINEDRDQVTIQARSLIQMVMKDLNTADKMLELKPSKK